MREGPEDLARLERLLATSIEQAGEFLRSAFEMPDHSLSASQLCAYLEGQPVVALGTTTAGGEPRVAPVAAVFYRARFCVPTVATAARARHAIRRPGVSLAHYVGSEVAIIAHGQAGLVRPGDPDFQPLDELHRAHNDGEGVADWGDGIFLRVEAARMFTFARHPERFPEGGAA